MHNESETFRTVCFDLWLMTMIIMVVTVVVSGSPSEIALIAILRWKISSWSLEHTLKHRATLCGPYKCKYVTVNKAVKISNHSAIYLTEPSINILIKL